MRFETYRATPGLEQFSSGERFAVYRAVHKRLMQENPSYRQRFQFYLAMVIVSAIGPSAFGVAIGPIPFPIVSATIIVFLAFRQQQYMNQCIGAKLQSQRHADHSDEC